MISVVGLTIILNFDFVTTTPIVLPKPTLVDCNKNPKHKDCKA